LRIKRGWGNLHNRGHRPSEAKRRRLWGEGEFGGEKGALKSLARQNQKVRGGGGVAQRKRGSWKQGIGGGSTTGKSSKAGVAGLQKRGGTLFGHKTAPEEQEIRLEGGEGGGLWLQIIGTMIGKGGGTEKKSQNHGFLRGTAEGVRR